MTTKYDFNFGFTPLESGFANMDIDRLMVAKMDVKAISVRVFTWKKPTISYGLNQNPYRRINIEKCLSDGIELVARPTGGREILHGWDLCLSVILPAQEENPGNEFSRAFDDINRIIQRALTRMGIKDTEYHSVTKKGGIKNGPCFSQIDRGEISVNGKKIVASAQRIFKSAVLQQSSISLKKPDFDITSYLKIHAGLEMSKNFVNSVAYLEDVLDETFSVSGIVEEIKGAFEERLGKSGILKLPNDFGLYPKNKRRINLKQIDARGGD